MKLLLESPGMRIHQKPGRVYVMEVFENLTRLLIARSLEVIWATPEWRQPWGLVIVMHESATYDADVRQYEVPPHERRAVGTNIVTVKPLQRMVIKSIGVGLGLVSRFSLSASSTLDEAVAAQLALIKRAEEKKRPY
jgi:hypothetical protein